MGCGGATGTHYFRFTADAIIVIDEAVAAGGVAGPDTAAQAAADSVEAAAADPKVREVLRRLVSPADWNRMNAVLELIEKDLGGRAAAATRGWATGNDLKRLHQTANSEGAVGPRRVTLSASVRRSRR